MTQLDVEILPYRLLIGSLTREYFAANLEQLLKAAFFTRETFFSYTESDTISIILDADLAQHFTNVNFYPQTWRCIEVFAGESGLGDLSKILHMIAHPFASNQISIFQVSTFSSDFTLIPEERMHDAIKCLGENFKVINPDEFTFDSAANKPHCEESSVCGSVDRHTVTEPLSQQVYIASLRDDALLASNGMNIIKRLLFPQRGFFSFTVVEGNLSLVMDKQAFDLFPADQLNLLDATWHLIEIGGGEGGLGFQESGIIATYTQPLATAGISCFYLSTYMTDLVLVPTYERTRNELKQARELFEGGCN